MISRKVIRILVLFFAGVAVLRCTPEKIILHGDISGKVTDTISGQPLQGVAVMADPGNDTASTGPEGEFQLINLVPGTYEIHASKQAYASVTEPVTVGTASTSKVRFAMQPIPLISTSSDILDFGIESTTLSFSISKSGLGKVAYTITPSQDWIAVDPMSGEIDNESDIITITLNRTGISQSSVIKEWVRIKSSFLQYDFQDTVKVYVNGVWDSRNSRYYKVVKIGTQIWMAENLDLGVMLIPDVGVNPDTTTWQSDNNIIEKYCYNNSISNCNIYGGLYRWSEMMQYNPPDIGIVGTTQGICPTGYHIPTCDEWTALIAETGGSTGGGALKETGTSHWDEPNEGATNSSGFNALGGGWFNEPNLVDVGGFGYFKSHGVFMGSEPCQVWLYSYVNSIQLNGCSSPLNTDDPRACSVRCIKDPGKK